MRRNKKLALLFSILIVIALLHFHFLPSWSGAYNDSCYLSTKKKEDLVYLLTNVVQACTAFNLTYWLDYGTLLGAVRHGGVLPWDGDGDISIVHPGSFYDAEPWISYLANKGISANMMVATYKDMTVDIMRWKFQNLHQNDKKTSYLYKYYPSSSKDSFIVKLNHKLDTFPFEWIEPRRLIDFHGTKAHIPYHADRLLRKRYPFSSNFRIPYKWKCWLPIFDTRN